jgi:hypothetical protein
MNKALGNKIKKLFLTKWYKAKAKEFEIASFSDGGCYLVMKSLRKVFGGEEWAVAEYDKDSNDWPLDHYVLKIGELFLDSNGLQTEEELLDNVFTGYSKKRLKGITPRLAPVKSEWPGEGLWQGEHLYCKKTAGRIVTDAKKLV